MHFFKFHLVLSQSYGAIYKRKECFIHKEYMYCLIWYVIIKNCGEFLQNLLSAKDGVLVRSFGRIPIGIYYLWRSFRANPFIFRSVIYRIHSRQGFTGSLIWVIWKRIIGSMTKYKHCAQRFWFELQRYFIYEMHFQYVSRVFTYSICVVVSGRNLALFLPIIVWNSSENWRRQNKNSSSSELLASCSTESSAKFLH